MTEEIQPDVQIEWQDGPGFRFRLVVKNWPDLASRAEVQAWLDDVAAKILERMINPHR